MIIKTGDVAVVFDLGFTTVSRYIKAGMPIHKEEGKAKFFHTAEVHKWLIEHEIAKRVGRDQNDEMIDYAYERARLTKAQADWQELKNEREDGQLLPIELIRYFLEKSCLQIASALDAVPADIKRRLPHLKRKELDIINSSIIKGRNIAARTSYTDKELQEAGKLLEIYEGKK